MLFRKIVCGCAVAVPAVLIAACSPTDQTTFVVGGSHSPSTPDTPVTTVRASRGFLWSEGGGLEEIPLPSYATSMNVTGMNNGGQVVGYVTLGEGTERYRAFIWSALDGFKALGSLVGPDGISMALTIDDAGTVRGLSDGPSANLNGGVGIYLDDAFEWTANSGMKPVNMVKGFPGFEPASAGGKLKLASGSDCLTVARINDRGEAVGYAGSIKNGECKYTAAVFWQADGQNVRLDECGPLPWCGITVRAINNRGEVVGDRNYAGFRWTVASGFVPIPMRNATANFINENGDVAGSVGTGEVLTPIVWMASGEIKTIHLPSGAKYGYPVAINARRQVAGNF